MGCASSSPLVNGGGPGGLVDSVNHTATEVMNSGETAMNEMGTNITESVGQMKETMVETVNGVANSVSEVIEDGMTRIPLKDTMESTNHLLEENLENLKNEMMNKVQSVGDETDKIADELIKDTEDVVRDAETGIVDMKNNAVETIDTMKNDVMEELGMKSPSHSVDTIQTSVPEPEIERILNGDDDHMSPEATVNELENLTKESNEAHPTAPEEPIRMEPSSMEPTAEETPPAAEEAPMTKPEDAPMTKPEDDLVVEDIKDEGRPAKLADRKLQKSDAVDEEDETTEDEESSSVEVPEEPPKTQWEELQDIYFQQRFIRARNASQESLLEDEFDCKINLSNMYEEPTEKSPKKLEKVISQDTLDVIDDFIKSFEKEMNDDAPKISVEP